MKNIRFYSSLPWLLFCCLALCNTANNSVATPAASALNTVIAEGASCPNGTNTWPSRRVAKCPNFGQAG